MNLLQCIIAFCLVMAIVRSLIATVQITLNRGKGTISEFLWAMIAPGFLIMVVIGLALVRIIDVLMSIQVVDWGG